MSGSLEATQRGWVRVLETAALSAFVVQGTRGLWHIIEAASLEAHGFFMVALVLTSLLASWLAADAMSGLIHYLGDRADLLSFPVVGPAFIRPFREHHVRPESILLHGWAERLGSHALGALPLLCLAIEICRRRGHAPLGSADLFLALFLVSLAFWIVLTGQIHVWAHEPSASRSGWVGRAQAMGLILSPEQHKKHHRGAHDSHYCITSGFWNRLADDARPLCDDNAVMSSLDTARRERQGSRGRR